LTIIGRQQFTLINSLGQQSAALPRSTSFTQLLEAFGFYWFDDKY